MKRFWKDVALVEEGGSWAIGLDEVAEGNHHAEQRNRRPAEAHQRHQQEALFPHGFVGHDCPTHLAAKALISAGASATTCAPIAIISSFE